MGCKLAAIPMLSISGYDILTWFLLLLFLLCSCVSGMLTDLTRLQENSAGTPLLPKTHANLDDHFVETDAAAARNDKSVWKGALEGSPAHPRSLAEKKVMDLVESLWIADQLTKSHRRVTCVQDKTYTISTVKQLEDDLLSELPCVFHAGLTPPVVPLGAMYGTIAYPDIPTWVNDLVYQGHYSTETVCNGETVYLDQMSMLGLKPTTGFSRIGKLKGSIVDGEHLDAKDSVVVDLSENFKDTCKRHNGTLAADSWHRL
eukprot:GHVS01028711.1.p1 GENE.GHVS01028711.1~~GHVS01028711.1.p1  ORF type:complete len:259 (+),score=19.77 GHVS01028711.1:135-911(+)